MQHPVNITGLEGHQLVIQSSGLFGSKLLLDEQPVPKAEKRGQFLLNRNDGTEVIAQLRRKLLDPVPDVVVDGQMIKVVQPFKWYQWLLIGLPILLLFIGGAIGGLYGLLAIMANTRIFRSGMKSWQQYVIVSILSVGAVIVFSILLLIPASYQLAQPGAGWQEFSPSEGGFSISMPGPPTEQTQPVRNENGSVDVHIFSVGQQQARYTVAYSDYGDVQGVSPDDFLDGVRDGLVAEKKLLAERSIALDGHPGRQLEIEAADGNDTIQARIFLVDSRLYQLFVVTPNEQASSKKIQEFFDSFVLLEK